VAGVFRGVPEGGGVGGEGGGLSCSPWTSVFVEGRCVRTCPSVPESAGGKEGKRVCVRGNIGSEPARSRMYLDILMGDSEPIAMI
jgi:hypothetical protein